jgi:hypothetical protein
MSKEERKVRRLVGAIYDIATLPLSGFFVVSMVACGETPREAIQEVRSIKKDALEFAFKCTEATTYEEKPAE